MRNVPNESKWVKPNIKQQTCCRIQSYLQDFTRTILKAKERVNQAGESMDTADCYLVSFARREKHTLYKQPLTVISRLTFIQMFKFKVPNKRKEH